MTCKPPCSLGDLLLDSSVRDKCIYLVFEQPSEPGGKKFFRDSCADSHGMTLSERSGGVLHTSFYIQFGMAGRHASPLPELHDVINGKMAGQCQYRIEHRRHMSGIKEKAVTVDPFRVSRIKSQEFRKEDVNKISSAHCSSGVPGVGFLHHSH